MSITIFQGSILAVKADAIINPANSFLYNGAGLAGVIQRAATAPFRAIEGLPVKELRARWEARQKAVNQYEQERKDHPLIATGAAGVTSAGALPYKGIIHVVGPIWAGGQFHEDDLLFSAYSEAFEAAVQRGWTSVAAPAVSAGIFGMPIGNVAINAVLAANYYATKLDVTFALMDDDHVVEFEATLAALGDRCAQ